MKKQNYLENLDGLRFLCFLSVFLYHSFYTSSADILTSKSYRFIKWQLFGNGNLGVNFFFVLSGFLITYLLIQEIKLNGKINLRNFWFRRVLRIWPLYYFCVFFGFIVFPYLKHLFGLPHGEFANPMYYLMFMSNFDMIYHHLPDASILGSLWSVAVEEQFYLLWPILLSCLPLRSYWIAFSSIILTSILYRAIHDSPTIHEMHTLSCIGDMTIGAFGAWLVHFDKVRMKVTNMPRSLIVLVYLLFALFFFFRRPFFVDSYSIRVFERPVIALVMLMIILEQSFAEKSFFKMKTFRIISRLGIISYGLYCLHFIGLLVSTTLSRVFHYNSGIMDVIFVDTFIAFLITVILSKLSFRYFEGPFLKLKERFSLLN
ncbi:MAG: acyltransferase [Bacteroidia bacterium]